MKLALAMLAAQLCVCQAQTSSTVSLTNGVRLRITTNGAAAALKTSLEPASGNSFYRLFRDDNNLVVFAYEIQVARTSDGDYFRITAKPATYAFADNHQNADGGKPVPTLSAEHESSLLASGQKFSIDVPTEPGLGNNLADIVEVRLAGRGAPEPRQAAGLIQFASIKVSINGKPAAPGGPGAVVSGRYAMFYIPGRGAYFFSMQPVDGYPFAKVGSVDHAHLEFTVDNETYDCDGDAPILAQGDHGEVWVYRDPKYRPAGNWTNSNPAGNPGREFFAAASDSLKWWLR
jgi:hypothetical protein